MRAIALLATHNEERFVGGCVEHLVGHGLEVYVIDNGSEDRTLEIVDRHRGAGVVGVESFPRHGVYSWKPLLERKAELASTLDADWFVHLDADEIRLPPPGYASLTEALAAADLAGSNAVNFVEFTFVPTAEHPDHDHPEYAETMRWYYPFRTSSVERLNAWRRQDVTVDLATSGGHRVSFPGLQMHPEPFRMKHYLFLSVEHACRKYVERDYDPNEVAAGWHRRRASLQSEQIVLQPESELRTHRGDEHLDASDPRVEHPLFGTQS